MAGCQHRNGTYEAEPIMDNGKLKHHHRCNDCNIIIGTW